MPRNRQSACSRRTLALGSVALGAMALAGKTARADEDAGASPEASPAPGNPALVLRMETLGGPGTMEQRLGAVPDFSLFDDGSIYRLGPVIAIYPPPALPNVTRMRVSTDAVEAIVEQARGAGLDQARDIPNPTSQNDLPSTRFWFNTEDGIEFSVAWGIIGEIEPPADWDEATLTAHQQLRELASYLANLPFNLPEQAVLEQEIPIDPDRLQVIAFEVTADQALSPEIVDLAQPSLTWPLATPLSDLATPFDTGMETLPEGSCAVLTGEDARAVVETSREGNLLSPWVDGDTTYGVRLTPLLPDQAGCEPAGPQ